MRIDIVEEAGSSECFRFAKESFILQEFQQFLTIAHIDDSKIFLSTSYSQTNLLKTSFLKVDMKLGTMDIGVEKIPQDSIVDVLGKLLFVIFYEITTFKRQERVAKYRITILCFQSIFRTEQTTDIT